MKTIWDYNGSCDNAKKIIRAHKMLIEYHRPLESYKEAREEFMKVHDLKDMELSGQEFCNILCKRTEESFCLDKEEIGRLINRKYSMRDSFDDLFIPDEDDPYETDEDFENFKFLTDYCFYKATMPSESGLADLINLACDNIKYSGYAAKLLEKIILADYFNINEFYTQTFLLLVPNTLMGEYSFTTLKRYDIAQRLYEKVKCGFQKSTSEALTELAANRLICCDFLSMTKLNPANKKTFTAMTEDSASDGFACTLLAFYYLTAHYNSVSQNNHDFILDEALEDYPNDTAEENKETFDSYHELGMQYLNKALSNKYRPAFYLFKYLGDNGLLTKYKSKEAEKFIRETPLRIIDPLLAV